MRNTTCSGEEMICLFHEYFNEKVVSDWLKTRMGKLQKIDGMVKLGSLTEPYEIILDDLIYRMAVASAKPASITQEMLKDVQDEVITALLIRWGIVTEYFNAHAKDKFPYNENLSQFILDYLTNHWRWIKKQSCAETSF